MRAWCQSEHLLILMPYCVTGPSYLHVRAKFAHDWRVNPQIRSGSTTIVTQKRTRIEKITVFWPASRVNCVRVNFSTHPERQIRLCDSPARKVRNLTPAFGRSTLQRSKKAFPEHLWPREKRRESFFDFSRSAVDFFAARGGVNSNYPSDYTLLICNVQSTLPAALFEQAPDVFWFIVLAAAAAARQRHRKLTLAFYM